MAAIIRQTFTNSLQTFFAGTAPLPVANGGTGATDAATARANLGAAAAADVASAVPAGTVIWLARSSAPTGYLVCDGSNVSRTTYATLFTAIGSTFGSGDGSTTFTLPDLRGVFIRGVDGGRGLDPGRSLGTLQAGSVEAHTHTVPQGNYSGFGGIYTSGDDYTNSVYTTPPSGSYGGTETRPINVALLGAIKT